MVDAKELQRVLAIAESHARAALTKPESQRESYLSYCRNNWKRYAAGVSKSAAECERFADALERATREMITLAEADALHIGTPRPDWSDAVEGAMDSVLAYEAHIAPTEPARTEAFNWGPLEPVDEAASAAAAEQREAEQADRSEARYGFGGIPQPPDPNAKKQELPEHVGELQRRVREVLRAHKTGEKE